MCAPIFLSPADDLQKALDAAPEGSTVRLAAGVYRQKAVIRRRLTLLGAGAGKTVLVYDDYAKKLRPDGQEYNTFATYTLAVCADGVTMRDLSVINDALHPESKGQEVALSVLGTDFLMERCVLTSTQDTLFAGPLPPDLIRRYDGFHPDELRRGGEMKQVYRYCRIEGTVDFIFGCGDALFDECDIRSLNDARNIGYIAAPAHSPEQEKGFLFRRCRLSAEEGVAQGSIYLARPWRDYGLVRFEDCICGAHIAAAGFDKWNDTRRDLTARFYESPAVPGRVAWVR